MNAGAVTAGVMNDNDGHDTSIHFPQGSLASQTRKRSYSKLGEIDESYEQRDIVTSPQRKLRKTVLSRRPSVDSDDPPTGAGPHDDTFHPRAYQDESAVQYAETRMPQAPCRCRHTVAELNVEGTESADKVNTVPDMKTENLDEQACTMTQQSSGKGAILEQIVLLYRKREKYGAKCVELRGRIARDEKDIGTLLAEASRYRESAKQRGEMVKKTHQLELETRQNYDKMSRLIQQLQHELDELQRCGNLA